MKPIKFRQLHECQNGHKRWCFIELSTHAENHPKHGYLAEAELKEEWGDKDPSCDCPTWDLGQGFSAIGEVQRFTGQYDKNNCPVYEGDILQVTGWLTSPVRYNENLGGFFYGGRRLIQKSTKDMLVIRYEFNRIKI